ncbi:MAG: hypothetical protein ACFCVK_09825 [Acidimicrobiales bacterium]
MEEGERKAVERWFVHQGLPHLIHGYGASTGVFNRALPFLLVVFAFNVVGTFGDRFTGWAQAAVAVSSAAIVVAVGTGVNVARGRRALQVPDNVGLLELITFVAAPAIPALVFGQGLVTAGGVVVANLVLLAVVYVVVGFGMVPTMVWAVRQTFRHLSQVVTLLGRALPFVLVFSAFLFLNAELWQVALDFTGVSFAITVGLLLAVAVAFLALRVPREIANVARFESWGQVCELAGRAGSPLTVATAPRGDGHGPHLSRAHRINVISVVLFNLAVQIVLVSALIGLFYVVFGMFAVRAETIVAWTSLGEVGPTQALWEFEIAGTEVVMSVALLRVVGFLAAFSALQFSVAAMTDATYREEFFDEALAEMRGTLAVRSLYLHHLVDGGEAQGEPSS